MSKEKRRDYGSGSVSQRKDGKWTARMIIGRQENGNLKYKTFVGSTEREAKKRLEDFKKEYYRHDMQTVQRNTVANYMLDWLHNVKVNELKPKSYDRLEQTITYQVIPAIGHLQVAAVQPDDVQRMINDLKTAGKSHSTIKKAFDAVNECFRTGQIKKTVIYNPALGVTIPAQKSFGKKQIKCYTKEEADRLCEAATACYGNGKRIYRLGNAVVLALNTRLRYAELLGLKWSEIDFENRLLTVSATRVIVKDRDQGAEKAYKVIEQDSGKTESSQRTIYINDTALEALTQLHEVTGDHEYVLTAESGNPPPQRYLDRMLRKIEVAAGFDEEKIYGFHALRHTFASRLFENGVDVKTVSEVLGHSDITITYNTYIHLIKDQKKKAVAKLDNL